MVPKRLRRRDPGLKSLGIRANIFNGVLSFLKWTQRESPKSFDWASGRMTGRTRVSTIRLRRTRGPSQNRTGDWSMRMTRYATYL